MIGLEKLGKSFGDRTLFEGVSLKLNAGSRYGLVGANGSGKTTLLKMLAGDEVPTEGTIAISQKARVGVLRQDRFLDAEQRIVDLAMMGDELVWALLAEQEQLLGTPEPDATRVTELEEQLRLADGYTLETRARSVLSGLGIAQEQQDSPLRVLSGGYQLRVLLAQVLVARPDALLLDEPTNHLDILTIRWLETFLFDYPGCAVVISHDQRFLNNVCSHILDVDYETVTHYVGNYDAFVAQKRLTRERKEVEIARAEKDIADKKAFVERFRAKASKARQAQSRIKQIEKIEVEKLPESSRRTPKFRFEAARPSGKDVLTLDGLNKAYGDNVVLSDVSLTVRRGERVGLIGANGLGKSTMLKILAGRLEADGGGVQWGHEAAPGYFAQDHAEILQDPDKRALDVIWDQVPDQPTTYVRGRLGSVLFSGDEVDKPVRALSGGEAARLVLCWLTVQKPNVLLLDEPTNHLDLEAIEALVEALKEYDGTIIFVSHDRWFVSSLATRIIELRADGPNDFPGTFEEYIDKCGDDHLDAQQVAKKAKERQRADKADQADAGLSWQEQKRQRNRQKELILRRDKVTAEIESLERRRAEIPEIYCQPGFFDATPTAEVEALQAEEQSIGPSLEAKLAEWEAVETELAALGE